jgi:hypothetical protein
MYGPSHAPMMNMELILVVSAAFLCIHRLRSRALSEYGISQKILRSWYLSSSAFHAEIPRPGLPGLRLGLLRVGLLEGLSTEVPSLLDGARTISVRDALVMRFERADFAAARPRNSEACAQKARPAKDP